MAASWTQLCDGRLTRSSSFRDVTILDTKRTSWQHAQLHSQYHPVLEARKLAQHGQLRVAVSSGKNIEFARANSSASGQGKRPGTEKQLDMDSCLAPPKDVHLPSFRAKLRLPPANSQLPRMDALIIVEGYNDCSAVHRTVRAPVFVLGGGYALAETMKPELRYLSLLAAAGYLPRQLVVFTDPDWQGRMFRTYLGDFLSQPQSPASSAANTVTHPQGGAFKSEPLGSSGKLDSRWLKPNASTQAQAQGQAQDMTVSEGLVVRHAFLRVELGTSDQASKNHEAGNVGVEHASPETIRTCLKRARRGFGAARKEFTLEELHADGLVGSWDDKGKVAGPQISRGRFCRALGLDEVGTGKALLNLLNRFFTREDYMSALQAARMA